MSTDRQEYSTDNQADVIRAYAAERGFEIVRTYSDEGKSGLRLEGRAGLKRLIADVEGGQADFEVRHRAPSPGSRSRHPSTTLDAHRACRSTSALRRRSVLPRHSPEQAPAVVQVVLAGVADHDVLAGHMREAAEVARGLLGRNPDTAYYDAHRAAARARFAGDARSFWHWSRVSAEVARISDNPMDIEEVERIVEDERKRAGR